MVEIFGNPTAARMFLCWDRYALRQRGIVLPDGEVAAARQMLAREDWNPYVLELYRDLLAHGSEAAMQETLAQLADMDAAIARATAIPARRYVLATCRT